MARVGEVGVKAPIALRPYQSEAVDRVRAHIRAGVRRILVVAPTGAGKTVLFAFILSEAARRDRRALVLAHRRELIDQTYDKLLGSGLPPESLGVIMASDRRRNPGALVQVASVDTLRNRAKPRADIVVIDEAHRALADTYEKISAEYPAAVHLGFTATPWRTDGRGLGRLYDELVVVASIPELVGDGFLVPTRVYSHPHKPDLSKVRTTGGDYNLDDLARLMDDGVLLGDLVEHYRLRGGDAPAFYFAVSVDHSKHIAETFNAAGIPAAHVDGNTPGDERAAALEGLRSGRFKVVSNCGVFTEGTDVPNVKVIGLVRPTKSRALAFQMAGRGMRPSSTGPACIVLDHAGVVQAHGHPMEPQDYSLEDAKKKKGTGVASTKTCPTCGLELPAGVTRCECGHVFERAEREALTEVPGQLVEIAPRMPIPLDPEREREEYRVLLQKAVERGAHSPMAYAAAVFTKRFNRRPDPKVIAGLEGAVAPRPPPKPMPEWLQRQLGKLPEQPAAPWTQPAAEPQPTEAHAERVWIEL